VATVSIEWFRDLVLIIFGLSATVALLSIAVLAFMFYFRARPVLDSVKKTAGTVAKITDSVENEMSGPLAQMASFVQGCRQAIGLFNRFFRREEEEE
jgi:uncharacterized protein YoxC